MFEFGRKEGPVRRRGRENGKRHLKTRLEAQIKRSTDPPCVEGTKEETEDVTPQAASKESKQQARNDRELYRGSLSSTRLSCVSNPGLKDPETVTWSASNRLTQSPGRPHRILGCVEFTRLVLPSLRNHFFKF
jgi:hypothetical protein